MHLRLSFFFLHLLMVLYVYFYQQLIYSKHFWQVFFPLPFVEYHPRIVSANEALKSKMKDSNIDTQAEMGETDQKVRASKTFVDGGDIFMSKFRDATFKRNTRPLIVHKVG